MTANAPAVSRTRNATIAREESAEFHHKGCLVLADRGYSREEIAAVMGLSIRSVRRSLSSPCRAYELERQEVEERRRYEEWQRTARGHIRFTRDDDFQTVTEARVLPLRRQIGNLLREGFRKADIARRLQVSKQVVQYHVRVMERAAGRGQTVRV
jgi:DNA-binding CsgD family transcriptional regulator